MKCNRFWEDDKHMSTCCSCEALEHPWIKTAELESEDDDRSDRSADRSADRSDKSDKSDVDDVDDSLIDELDEEGAAPGCMSSKIESIEYVLGKASQSLTSGLSCEEKFRPWLSCALSHLSSSTWRSPKNPSCTLIVEPAKHFTGISHSDLVPVMRASYKSRQIWQTSSRLTPLQIYFNNTSTMDYASERQEERL